MATPKSRRDVDKLFKEINRSHKEQRLAEFQREVVEDIAKSRYRQPAFKGELVRLADSRARYNSLVSILYNEMFVTNNAASAEGFIQALPTLFGNSGHKDQILIFKGWVWKDRGAALFRQGDYAEARNAYLRAIQETLGQDTSYVLPSPTAVNEILQPAEPGQFSEVTICVNNIAQCYVKENNPVVALDWLEEVYSMYESYVDFRKQPPLPWKDLFMSYEEFMTTRMKAYLRATEIYRTLGNTSAALGATWDGFKFGNEMTNSENEPPNIRKIRAEFDTNTLSNKRHPDPKDISTIQIIEPSLQVRGVWKKLHVQADDNPPTRFGAASVIWKGKYYVFGGEHGSSKLYDDGWVIDLRNPSSWQRVKTPKEPAHHVLHHRFVVHNERAYLFQGKQTLPYFDLRTETWFQVRTKTWDGTQWSLVCPDNQLLGYTAELYTGKMYIFGGKEKIGALGRNVLMALDLTTFEWEVLSGTVKTVGNVKMPGLRSDAASWTHDGKMYITLGAANRSGAKINKAEHGAISDISYRDIWSYDFEQRVWTQEKYIGNPPCRRAEVGYTFNKKWNRAVVFGGYDSCMPFFQVATSEAFSYSYYGDTFVWSAETRRWSQVVTRGFPTYRAMPDLVTDQATGKTYLFGGYTNTEYTPSTRSSSAQSFNDLWELAIDVPGGSFNEADFEIDPRFSKLGPWKTCFTCGSVGRWRMCGGTCRLTDRAAYFCGKECLKSGWAEHKKECKKA